MIHPLLGLALRLKARELPAKDGDKIRAGLLSPGRHAALEAASDFAIETQSHEWLLTVMASAAGGVAAAHDGHILKMLLDFINAHWAEILALILKAFGL